MPDNDNNNDKTHKRTNHGCEYKHEMKYQFTTTTKELKGDIDDSTSMLVTQ